MTSSFIEIKHGSESYDLMTELRRDILRRPLGLDFSKEELMREKEDIFLAAFIAHEIVACCILSNPVKETIKLRQMAVKQHAQKQGIGASLLRFAETTAQAKGFSSIRLNARLSAQNFYAKYGYQSFGDIFEEVGIPHIQMIKELK
jgi:predicted GNAT family N-acyltransferase